MDLFTQFVVTIGRITPAHIEMLGTAFLISNGGLFVTSRHVIGDNHTGLVVLAPHIQSISAYQDVGDKFARCGTKADGGR